MSNPPLFSAAPIGRARRFAFTLIALAIVVGAIELLSFAALRLLVEQPDVRRSETHLIDAHRNHRLNPDFRLPDGRAMHASDGLRRDKPLAREKPPGTVRILALGTSALYGIASAPPYPPYRMLANDETITHYLEGVLRQRLAADGISRAIEVINGGVSAYKTLHELMYLNADLLDYEPDIVINIDGHNDFYDDTPADRWNSYAYSASVVVDEYNGRTAFLAVLTVVRSLAPYSQTANVIERFLRRALAAKNEQPMRHTPRKAFTREADFEKNFRAVMGRQSMRELWQIHQLGRYAGYDHYVFLQPELVFESDAYLSDADRKLKAITLKALPAEHPAKMQRVRALLPTLFAEREIPFFDVATIGAATGERPQLYTDYCHLTPAGAERTAQAIATHLYPRLVDRIRRSEDPSPRR